MKTWSIFNLLLVPVCISFLYPACAGNDVPPPGVVEEVDLNRYLGTWYEIARLPFSRQEGCVGTTATYGKLDDGDIEVINRCYAGSFDGELREAKGRAWVVDKKTRAKLEVQFFWPFSGDYWVLELEENYEYAVVGTPDYKYMWILSRKPQMEEDVYSGIVSRAKERGYDTSRLEITEQKKAAD